MRELIIITGPTAVGKTALSIEIALQCGFEIISADSRQVYRHMRTGTARVTPEEMKGVEHHLLGIVDPDEEYNAYMFARDAEAILDTREKAIIVGGTLFYIKALLEGSLRAPPVDPEVKAELLREYNENPGALIEELAKKDAIARGRIQGYVIKIQGYTLSVIRTTGRPYSSFIRTTEPGQFKPKYLIASLPVGVLYERINNRVDAMVEDGLFEEVEKLLNMGYSRDLVALKTPGYREVTATY